MHVDYYRPSITSKEIAAATRVLKSGNFACGENVSLFEYEFSKHCGGDYCVMLSSATAAIYLWCKYNKNQGLQKITIPAYTFTATWQAAKAAGLEIEIADVNNCYEVMKFNTPDIIVVTVAGSSQVLYSHVIRNLFVDSSHNFPFESDFDRCYSFYATKPLCCGNEGGMIVTKNKDLASWARLMRQHGREGAIGHASNNASIGFNFKPSEISAAIALEQLKRIDYLKSRRLEIAQMYLDGLKGIDCYYGDHLFLVRPESKIKREYIQTAFMDAGIEYSRPYIPLADRDKVPNAWYLYDRSISLPFFVDLTKREISCIIDCIRKTVE